MPVLSDTNTLTNTYNYKIFRELYENNVSTFSFLFKSANSLTDDDIKLSERLYIPGKLRVSKLERLDLKMEVILLVEIMYLVLTQQQQFLRY